MIEVPSDLAYLKELFYKNQQDLKNLSNYFTNQGEGVKLLGNLIFTRHQLLSKEQIFANSSWKDYAEYITCSKLDIDELLKLQLEKTSIIFEPDALYAHSTTISEEREEYISSTLYQLEIIKNEITFRYFYSRNMEYCISVVMNIIAGN